MGGFLLTLGWTVRGICSLNALVALLVALVILMIGARVGAYAMSPKVKVPKEEGRGEFVLASKRPRLRLNW